MDDWQKTLIGTLSGFLTGVLLEPIKFHIASRLRRAELRRDLYDHLGRVRFAFARWEDLSANPAVEVGPGNALFDPRAAANEISADLFTFLAENEKAAVYGLPEYFAFKQLYKDIAEAREAIDLGKPSRELLPLAVGFREDCDRFTREGILSPRRLYQSIRVHRRRLAVRINKYYGR